VDADGGIHLIDFDRARVRRGDSRAFRSNLGRMRRSLDKVWPGASRDQIMPSWRKLLEGYKRGARSA